MSATSATIYRTRSERVDIDAKGLPVLSEEITVISAGLKVGEVLAFGEALKRAGAKPDSLVTVDGTNGLGDKKHLRCMWREILPGDGPE